MVKDDIIWAYLAHLGFNMWADRVAPEWKLDEITAQDHLRFDTEIWRELTDRMVDAGINMVVLDLGEGVKYRSHPELAVEGSWSVDELMAELARLRGLGLEPIPKMNFSACHDAWLGPYARMLSTDIYYGVCKDLISEVVDIFDKPRFFHLGMDEETAAHQAFYDYVVIRQFDLWWHDLMFYIQRVEAAGVRPWVWSDYVWEHSDLFFQRMPKSVLQSNWYYAESFAKDISYVKAYLDLEAYGYDQIPTGSNWSVPTNFGDTVEFAHENIAPERLKGFFQSVWRPTTSKFRERHLTAIEQVAVAKRRFEGR